MSHKHKAVTGSIHRIREFELEKVCLAEEFDILQIVGEGWFGKILLVEHRGTDTEMVLKALPKPYVALRDFYREFHYGLHLAQHKNIITTYDVAFETAGFYVFSQEYAPLGDLTSNVSETGIGELHTKRVSRQLGAALEYLHSKDLVHRDVKLDNILIFKSDFSRIKLCDFGETRKINTDIPRRNEWLPYCPPELLRVPIDHTYKAATMHDVWQFGIVVFVCLTGCLPWQKAAMDDPRYVRYLHWYNTSNPLRKQPKLFKLVSSKAQRLFKRFLEPRPEKRPTGLGDLSKYLDDRWMAKGINDKNGNDGPDSDELCPSMYSFHSDIDEKNKLLNVLLQHGMETTVDRVAKKERIKDWIQNSIIVEEDENEIDDELFPEKSFTDEDENYNDLMHPIEKTHQRWSSMRYDTEKHINPRTGEVFNKQHNQNYHNEMNNSYDMKNIEPLVIPSHRGQTNKKDESPTHSSIKDSAYGSIDFKPNNKSTVSVQTESRVKKPALPVKSYPSERLQQDIQQGTFEAKFNNISKPNNQQYHQKRGIGSNSIETNVSVVSINSLENGTENNRSMNNVFTSMKDNAYDNVRKNSIPPADSPLSVVHGQMRINPYAQMASGKSFPDPTPNKSDRLNGSSNGLLKNDDLLDEEEKNSIVQIKKMLIENRTGIIID